jgi:poly(A) polymerase
MNFRIVLPPLVETIRPFLPGDQKVYLVGGSVRDLLLDHPVHDLDFAMTRETRRTAHRIAEKLRAGYYLLDDERDTSRVVYWDQEGKPFMLDFVVLVGNNLDTDLHQRDYTINAIAIDLAQPEVMLDPCGGIEDLRSGLLRTCSPASLANDPLRILRGVRLANQLNFQIEEETRRQMREYLPLIMRVSPERLRDELFRMLDGERPVSAIKTLEELGGLIYVLPELVALKGVEQSIPHVLDVWSHSLGTLRYLEKVMVALSSASSSEWLNDPIMSLLVKRLGCFWQQIDQLFSLAINPNRKRRGLLNLAALYHDVAKPMTHSRDEEGHIRAFGHDELGAELLQKRARALQLSNDENEHLQALVRHHMRIHYLAQLDQPPSRRAIYRIFKDTGKAGVEICLLSLADTLATYESTLPLEVFSKELDVCQNLLEAWWEKPAESVRPVALVNGNDLINELGLSPGPLIGQVLEAVREAQADGQVHDRQGALDFSRQWVRYKKTPGLESGPTQQM